MSALIRSLLLPLCLLLLTGAAAPTGARAQHPSASFGWRGSQDAAADDSLFQKFPQLKGVSRFKPGDPHLAIAEALLKVKEGGMTPEQFFMRLGELRDARGNPVSMRDVISVKTQIEKAGGRDLLDHFLGERFAAGGSPVEQKLLQARRKVTIEALQHVARKFSGHPLAQGSRVFLAPVGKWATQDDAALTFSGDIDASLVSGNAELIRLMRDEFARYLRERTKLTMTQIDSIITAHGQATGDVYVGEHGRKYGDQAIAGAQVQEIDLKRGVIGRHDMPGLEALGHAEFEAKMRAVDRGWDPDKAVRQDIKGEPGFSMEMARHLEHDIVKGGIFNPVDSIVKTCKYLDRSNKFFKQETDLAPAQGRLADFAAEVTAASKTASPADMALLVAKYFGEGRMPWDVELVPGPDGVPKAALKANQLLVEGLFADARNAIWGNVRRGMELRLEALKTRKKDLEGARGDDEAANKEREKVLQETDDIQKMLLDEIREFGPEEFKRQAPADVRILVEDYIRLAEGLRESLGAKAFMPEQQKQFDLLKSLLADNPDPNRLALAAAVAMDLASKTVDEVNARLDWLDDSLMGPLRGDPAFDQWLVEVKRQQAAAKTSGRGGQAVEGIRQAAKASLATVETRLNALLYQNRFSQKVRQVNVWANQKIQSTRAGQAAMKGLTAFNLASEIKAYSDTLAKDGMSGLAAEFIRRRVPLGSAAENLYMGNYLAATWDVFTTLFPPAGLVQAAYSFGNYAFSLGWGAYWSESLGVFVDGLYAGAKWKVVGTVKYKDAERQKFELISVTFKDVEMQRADLESDLRPLDRWFMVELTLRQNLMDTDPALVLIDEMRKHPAVGEKLKTHFDRQYLDRWREVKLNFVRRMFKELEERKNSEDALAQGQLPKMYAELMALADELDSRERMQKAMDREWASNNLQLVAQYLHDLKRAISGQAPTESEENRAATIVTRYLDFYRPFPGRRQALEDYLSGLYAQAGLSPVPDPTQHRLRLLTGMPFLTCVPAEDQKEAKRLEEAVRGVESQDRMRLVKIKEGVKAGSDLDGEFDRKILAQLVFHGAWARVIDLAKVPVISNAGYQEAKLKHLEARSKLFREFAAHYGAAPALLVQVRLEAQGKPGDEPVPGAQAWLADTTGKRLELEPRGPGDFAAAELPAGRYTVFAQAPGHAAPEGGETARREVTLPQPPQGKRPDTQIVTLTLRPAQAVSPTTTRVVDVRPGGAPGQWALTLRALDDKQADVAEGLLRAETSLGRVSGAGGAGPWPLKGAPLSLLWEALPEQEGLKGTLVFTYLGDASGPEKQNQRYQPSQTSLAVPPGAAGTLWVRVVDAKDASRPIGDARVKLTGASKHNSRVRMEQTGGAMSFTPLPAGDYSAEVNAPAYASAKKTATLAADGPPAGQVLEVALEPLPVVGVAVTVVNARQPDQVIESARVTLSGNSLGGPLTLEGQGSGRVVFAGTPQGSYTAYATAPGFNEGSAPVYVNKDSKGVDARLRLEPLGDLEERRPAFIRIDCPDRVMATDIFTATAVLPPKAAAAANTYQWSGPRLITPQDEEKRVFDNKGDSPTAQLQYRRLDAVGMHSFHTVFVIGVSVRDANGREVARGSRRIQVDPASFGVSSSWEGGAGDWGVRLKKLAERLVVIGKHRNRAHVSGALSVKWCQGSCRQSIKGLQEKAAKDKRAHLEKINISGFEGLLMVYPPRFKNKGSDWVDVRYPEGIASFSGVAGKGQEYIEISGYTGGSGYHLGTDVIWHDDIPFVQAQVRAQFAELLSAVKSLKIKPGAGLTYQASKGPAWNGADMPKVVLTASNTAPKIGDTVTFTASVERLPSGEAPLAHTWTGANTDGDGKGPRATLTVAKDGKQTVSVAVQGAQTYLGSASVTLEVSKTRAELVKLSPAGNQVAVGTPLSFAVTMTGAPPGTIYRWEPSNELKWQGNDTAAPRNQGQALKPGRLTVWVEVLAGEGGGQKTVASSNRVELEVVKPKLVLKATPAPPQPVMIGQPVRVRLEAEPAPPELDVRWLPLSSSARQTSQSADGREITFVPLNDKPVEIKALARVPGGGEDLGEAVLTVKAQGYKAEVAVVGQPFEPQFPVWTKTKGLVKVEKGYRVGQQVAVKVTVPGHPDQASLRYRWKVSEGCTAGGTLGQVVNVTRSELGSCACQVEVRDASDTVVAQGEGGFQVSLSNEMIEKGRQMTQEGKKPGEDAPELAKARKLWEEGAASEAVALLEKGLKSQPGHAGLAALLKDYRGRLTRLREHLEQGRRLLSEGDVAGARRQVTFAGELCRNYPPLAVLAGEVGARAAQLKQNEDEAKRLVKEGAALEKSGDPAGALALFKRAYALVPNQPLMARIAALKDRMAREAQDAKRAKELVKEGVALENSGRKVEALEKLRQAYRLAPNPILAERIRRLQQ